MTAVWPGGVIGIIGGGQLARMMALEARRMGYQVAVLDPDPAGPAAAVADHFVQGSLDDLAAAEKLAVRSDVITLDTEHVPADLLERLEAAKPVRPSAAVMRVIQDRLEQRRFLESHDVPQPRYAAVSDAEGLRMAAAAVGLPCVLKTRRTGYDGKGQARVAHEGELDHAWQTVGRVPALVESFIDFDKEISVLLARDTRGEIRFYPIVENVHRRHILHTSRVPARLSLELKSQAEELSAHIAAALGHIGVMAVELFVTRDEQLLVNEAAPRPHNSGHHTFGSCVTSQFEQHVRAVCGLPLGDPSLMRSAVMVNLLGDLWRNGPPSWRNVLSHPGARIHLYGKKRASPGRKMGHVVILDEDPDRALGWVKTWMDDLERDAAVGLKPGGDDGSDQRRGPGSDLALHVEEPPELWGATGSATAHGATSCDSQTGC